jgi:hypothetical protein
MAENEDMTSSREYEIAWWLRSTLLFFGLFYIVFAALLLKYGRGMPLPTVDPDAAWHVRLSISLENKVIFLLGFGLFCLWWAITHAWYRVVVDETGLRVRSLRLDRRVDWKDVAWCDVYWYSKRGRGTVALGTSEGGRGLAIPLSFLRHKVELAGFVVSHTMPRNLRPRRAYWFLVVPIICMIGTPAAMLTSVPAWLVAAAVGALTVFVFLRVRQRFARIGVAVTISYVVAALVSVGVASCLRTPVGWTWLGLALAMFGGWAYGFILMRQHEEAVRRMPGADWARVVDAPSALSAHDE